jgi:hypothetical protein
MERCKWRRNSMKISKDICNNIKKKFLMFFALKLLVVAWELKMKRMARCTN